MVKEDLALVAQRNAKAYSKQVAKKRRKTNFRKAVIVSTLAAFFLISCKVVGDNDLEAEGIVLAQEEVASETKCDSELITGVIFQKNLIETENGLLYPYVIDLPEGTEIIMEYHSNGTAHPNDDEIVKVVQKN